MSWTNDDAATLRELLAPAGLLRRLFKELEEDLTEINQATSIQGSTVEELAVNLAHRKGVVEGILRTMALLESYSKENPDG